MTWARPFTSWLENDIALRVPSFPPKTAVWPALPEPTAAFLARTGTPGSPQQPDCEATPPINSVSALGSER